MEGKNVRKGKEAQGNAKQKYFHSATPMGCEEAHDSAPGLVRKTRIKGAICLPHAIFVKMLPSATQNGE